MPKKETTPSSRAKLATGQAIDDLAVMVKKGFIGVDKKFNDIEKNMARKDDVRKGFDEVNQRLIKIERKIDSNHEQRIEQRIEKLEDDVKWLKGQLTLEGS